MILPCSCAASQEEEDDLRDGRAGQHPLAPGQEGKSNRRGNGNRQDRKKPQSARRPGGTPNSENRKLEKKFRERKERDGKENKEELIDYGKKKNL